MPIIVFKVYTTSIMCSSCHSCMQEEQLKKMLLAQTFSILTIFYNCVQRKECLPLILSEKHLSDSLASITLSPNLDIRFLSKLVLGFLALILTAEQCDLLELQHDEIAYFISSLNKISQSPDDVPEGYSADELLQGLLNFSKMGKNLLVCLDPTVLKIFNSFLELGNQSCQSLILQIIWNTLISADERVKERRKKLLDFVPAIKTFPATSMIKTLQQSVLFLIQQRLDASSGMCL